MDHRGLSGKKGQESRDEIRCFHGIRTLGPSRILPIHQDAQNDARRVRQVIPRIVRAHVTFDSGSHTFNFKIQRLDIIEEKSSEKIDLKSKTLSLPVKPRDQNLPDEMSHSAAIRRPQSWGEHAISKI